MADHPFSSPEGIIVEGKNIFHISSKKEFLMMMCKMRYR